VDLLLVVSHLFAVPFDSLFWVGKVNKLVTENGMLGETCLQSHILNTGGDALTNTINQCVVHSSKHTTMYHHVATLMGVTIDLSIWVQSI